MTHLRREIDRYLSEGLAAQEEAELRQHLRACEDCRRFYDEEVMLRRALAGDPAQPTRTEETRLRQLILARSGLKAPVSVPVQATGRSLTERLGWLRWSVALPMAAAMLALIIGIRLVFPLRAPPPRPAPQGAAPSEPVLAARIVQAKDATIAGVPARPGSAVPSDAVVAVSAEGFAEVSLVRGGRARLFPRTRLKLTPRGEAIALDDGKLWCDVDPGRGRFVVRVLRGEVRVLGTSFIVEDFAGGDADVRVLSGVVEVEDVGHRGVVRVHEGQRTRLGLDAPPAWAQGYDSQSDRADWEQALKNLGRELQRSIRKLGDKLRLP